MVGVAAIGAGNWGRNLLRNLASLPEVRLRYICDLDEEARGRAAIRPNVRTVNGRSR